MSKVAKILPGSIEVERGVSGKVDLHEEGTQLLYCTGNTVVIRDMRDLSKNDSYQDHLAQVNVARFSPNGNYVASGDSRGLVRVWSPNHPEKMLKKETPVFAGGVNDLCWDSESKRIVAGGNGGKSAHCKTFMFDSGSALGEMVGHEKPVLAVAARTAKPLTAITGGEDFKVNFYKGPPMKFVKSAGEHTNFVRALRYSFDGSVCCSVSSDSMVKLYDAETGDLKKDFDKVHAGSVFGCSFDKNGKIVTVGGDKTARLWDVETGKVITTITIGNQTEDMQVGCASSRGGPVSSVSISLGGTVSVLDFDSGSVSSSVKSFSMEPTAVACNKDTKDIYVGDTTGKVTRYDSAYTAEPVSGRGHAAGVNYIQANKGKVYTSSLDDQVKVVDKAEFKCSASLGGNARTLHSTPDQSDFVAFVTQKKAGLVKADGQIVASVDLDFDGVGVAVSPKLDKLIVGAKKSKDFCAYVYDIAGGSSITKTDKVLELESSPTVMAYSPDGKYLAIGTEVKEVTLFNGETLAPLIYGFWVYHSSGISSLAFSPNSQYLLSTGRDSSIIVWKCDDKKKKEILKLAHKGGVNAGDWVDDTTVVTVGVDRTCKVWEIKLPE